MRLLRQWVALLPIATTLALFVHAFTGEDHAVAGGHGGQLGALVAFGTILWAGWLARSAFRGRRAGASLSRALSDCLPGRGRIPILAAVLAFEGALSFAGIESSEGRLLAALHLAPLVCGGLFTLGGIGFAGLARALAEWAMRAGVAVAEIAPTRLEAHAARQIRSRRPMRAASSPLRRLRGRAPPIPLTL